MPHVIVTAVPGAGKTTLLAALADMAYITIEESARAIIAGRLARGESRRPDLVTFAREILRRDIEKYFRRRVVPVVRLRPARSAAALGSAARGARPSRPRSERRLILRCI